MSSSLGPGSSVDYMSTAGQHGRLSTVGSAQTHNHLGEAQAKLLELR